MITTHTHTHTHNYWKFCSIFLFMFVLISCYENNNEIETENLENSTTNTINFKGLSFKNSYGLEEADINRTKKGGFKTILQEAGKKYYKSKGLAFKFEEEYDIDKLIQATVDMLPYLPFQEEGINEAMILRDLPDLTSETFVENQDVIDDYYNTSLDVMVANRYYDDTFEPYVIGEYDNYGDDYQSY